VDGWVVGQSLEEARQLAGAVQGRRTTLDTVPPIELPSGEWDATLRTTWTEPGYVEPDAAWCLPGGRPASALGNGGAFGGKVDSEVGAVARRLADAHGRAVRVLYRREDVARLGPKRPPMAGGFLADGTGEIRVARTPGIAAAISAVAPLVSVVEVDVAGPPTSAALRASGWAEALIGLAGARSAGGGPATDVVGPGGGRAWADVTPDGSILVEVDAGRPLDEVVLRSYCIGAAHMALGWVTTEALTVDDVGEVHDLTIRSFGVLRAVDMPHVEVEIRPSEAAPVNGSDAVFVAVAAAVWISLGRPADWPAGEMAR
jgi:hypothetical protein